ncbi:unnamed protein product [Urochloa humidicola]
MRQLLLVCLFLFLPHAPFSAAAAAAGRCVRQCGSKSAPYPFGFSGDCPILLTCNTTSPTAAAALLIPPQSAAAAASYPIVSFNSSASTFVVSVAPSCSRTVAEARAALAGGGYDVSYRTSLFLSGSNCSRAAPPGAVAFNCSVSPQIVDLRAQCGGGGGRGTGSSWTTCVASTANIAANTTGTAARGQFMDWKNVRDAGCEDALTAALYADTPAGTPAVEFGVAEMGWWLNGTCAGGAGGAAGECVANATCRDVETPGGLWGHRCACRDGMSGDGFAAGEGCHYGDAERSKKIPLIVAGVAAGAVAAGGALLVCLVQCRRCKARRWSSERLAAMRLLSEAATSSGVPVYSYAEVARATNSFSHTHRLGTGAYGTVYVGKLPGGGGGGSPAALVAIKRLHCRHHHHDADGDDAAAAAALLLNEIKLISSVSHPNLVRLLGCCLDRGEQILLYEYVPNGTLSHHLAAGSAAGGLPWRARLGVAAETAAAIAHLHGMRPPIFHRDVKSSNILLDAALRPKLADFGLSRSGGGGAAGGGATRSHVSTAPQGTPGYVDPEYHQSFHLSDKSDVYSFGVVLLELITAMKVVDFDRPAAEVNLASLALDRIGKGRVAEIVDPAILAGEEEEWVMESVRHVSELAFRCLAFHKDVRPAMTEVAAELCRIRDAAAPSSGSDDHPDSRLIRPMMVDVHVDVSLDGAEAAGKKAVSPVSVQEVWTSDRSSPSTNGSMPRSFA